MTELESLLTEWAKWTKQGCELAESYPSAWPLEHIWVPYKVGATAEERLEELEATTPANERIGQRVELWVNQLDPPPLKVALRVRWVYLPDGVFETFDARGAAYKSNRRAWETFRRLNESGHKVNGISADKYEQWLGEAMSDLRWMYQKWAEGV